MPISINPAYLITTPFVTNAQFFVRYDWRWVAKNVLDISPGTGLVAAATLAQLLDTSSVAGTVVYECLFEASEMLVAAAAVGARYTVEELVAAGGRLLIRVVCDLCVGLILKRRGRAVTDENALSQPYNEALGYLEALRRGERIFFMVPAVPEAGLPESASMNPIPGIDPPLITTDAIRYFGLGGPQRGGCWGPG